MKIEGFSRYKISWKWTRGPHLQKELSPHEGKQLLSKGGWFFINAFDFDCEDNTAYWHVIKDSFGGIEEIPSKYRGRLRKSLDLYEFKIVPREFVLENCYEVHKAAAEHYRVKAHVPSKTEFDNHILALDESYDFWVSIHKDSNNIAGFAINHIVDEMCDYESMKYHPDYLKPVSPSYGLIYRMNEYYLVEKNLKYVDDGARSITEHSDIQHFLIDKYRFRKAFCHVKVFYKWWFKIVVLLLRPFNGIVKHPSMVSIMNLDKIARNKLR